jgi:outer membrane protein assembly factor BamB
LRWADDFGTRIQAGPVVSNGHVFIATFGGDVAAVDAMDGHQIWKTNVGGFVRATPSIDGSVLIVAVYDPSSIIALDADTGAVLWQTKVASWGTTGVSRAEPLITGGKVYVATASGDAPTCDAGTIAALSETSGDVLWHWSIASAGQGVGIWSPISLSPYGDILFGSGNSCAGVQYFESAVAINAETGAFHWQADTSRQGPDVDVGGGVAEFGNYGFFTGKDGNLYAADLSSGRVLWQRNLGAVPGFGSIATPVTDGVNVITQSGALTNPNVNPGNPGSALYDYGIDGTLRWKAGPFQVEEFSSPVITSDVVITGVDNDLQVRNLDNGALLWSYETGGLVYASPAVVASGIYITSMSGKLYGFGVGTGSAQAITRRMPVSSSQGQTWKPWNE